MKRYAILNGAGYNKALMFSSVDLTDSQFLHNILCEVSPRSDYIVAFTNKYPRTSKMREWYYGPQREVDLPDFSEKDF